MFSPKLVLFVPIGAVSLIHSALERNAATLRKVLAPFSFSHVTDSCSLFISFLIFVFFFLYLITISGCVFNKTLILLGLAGYQIITTNSARYLSFDVQRALVELYADEFEILTSPPPLPGQPRGSLNF